MKITFDRKPFLDALSLAASVVPSRSPKPILQNVKLTADADGVSLAGTDLEVGVRVRVEGCKVDVPGDSVLPPIRMLPILKTSSDAEMSVQIDDGKLVVKGGRSRFAMTHEDPALFPDVPDFDTDCYAAVIGGEMKKLVRRTSFAVDPNNTRYALGGALVELQGETMAFVCTDGRRLARAAAAVERIGDLEWPGAIIPLKALKLIDRVIGDDGELIHFAIDADKAMTMRTDGCTVYSRLVEGRFPKYSEVFPRECAFRVPLVAGAFRLAVEQASIVTSEESRGVAFKFSESGVELTSAASEVGESKIDLPLLTGIGGEVTATLDPSYVVDALRALDAETPLEVELTDGQTAVVFKSGDEYTYVVMPITK